VIPLKIGLAELEKMCKMPYYAVGNSLTRYNYITTPQILSAISCLSAFSPHLLHLPGAFFT